MKQPMNPNTQGAVKPLAVPDPSLLQGEIKPPAVRDVLGKLYSYEGKEYRLKVNPGDGEGNFTASVTCEGLTLHNLPGGMWRDFLDAFRDTLARMESNPIAGAVEEARHLTKGTLDWTFGEGSSVIFRGTPEGGPNATTLTEGCDATDPDAVKQTLASLVRKVNALALPDGVRPLTPGEVAMVKAEMVPPESTHPVRFQTQGLTMNIVTGYLQPKGINVIHQTHYWAFPRETALRIAALTGTKAVFSE